MAEFIMKDKLLKEKLELLVLSAGTSGFHDGEDMHYKTRAKLMENSVKIGAFESKKLSQKMCDESDLIITMDDSNYKIVLQNYTNVSHKLKKACDFAKDLAYKEVPDPWYSGNFDETYTILNLVCDNLIKHLKSSQKGS